jgi:multifunctional methyltransferase subunit TRM112
VETLFNDAFIRHIASSLHWPAVLIAANAVGLSGFPESLSETLLEDTDFLQALHHLLLDIHIVEGTLICPESGKRFTITDGIPNLM